MVINFIYMQMKRKIQSNNLITLPKYIYIFYISAFPFIFVKEFFQHTWARTLQMEANESFRRIKIGREDRSH